MALIADGKTARLRDTPGSTYMLCILNDCANVKYSQKWYCWIETSSYVQVTNKRRSGSHEFVNFAID